MIYDENNWRSPTRQVESEIELSRSSITSTSGENVYLDSICLKNTELKCTVRSKNLIPLPYPQDNWIEINGLTFELVGDGGIYVHGTGNQPQETIYLLQTELITLAPGSYVLSGSDMFFNPITSNEELRLDVFNADASRFEGVITSGVFTITEEKRVRPYLYFGMGAQVDAVFYPMISIGDSYNGLVDYSMNVPLYSATVTVEGITTKTYEVNSDGSVDNLKIDGDYAFIKVEPKGLVLDVSYRCFQPYKNFNNRDRVKQLTVERIGDTTKFFGFGVCQKANLHLVDKDREIDIKASTDRFKPLLQTKEGTNYVTTIPYLYVTEVHRDENTNELSITAYDVLYGAGERTVSELDISAPYTIREFAAKCASLIGASGLVTYDDIFKMEYPEGANLEGTETIREVLDAIAEVTQTIYYIDGYGYLIFKRLDKDGDPVLTITKDDYFTLDSKTNRRLSAIASVTELGDNIEAALPQAGTTQYIRDNPFLDLRADRAELVNNALELMGGLTINQFDCSWRGNPALEPGDKIALVTKDNETVYSYVLNDTIEYTGGLTQKTSWEFGEATETESNPTSLGEALKLTFAKVDKANQQIEIVAAETTALRLNADSISATVTELNKEVNTKISADKVSFIVQEELAEGANKVITSTGFTFDDKGLSVTKSDSEISTTISEDGMKIYRKNAEVLVADNQGVRAEDLHATTYLIVGNNSRFEDYDGNRTGCFWVGNQGG
jgi:hypothetical protein